MHATSEGESTTLHPGPFVKCVAMGARLHLRLPIRATHRHRGPGFLGLVASVTGSKTRPLFLTESDMNLIRGGSARWKA